MGDAVMAFWGPPFTGAKEHGALACRAALAAVERLELFREEVAAELGDEAQGLDIDIRIGISTGDMIVGTVGSDVSKSYTVVGDPVNLGARLEGANKAYGTHILVAAETREQASETDLLFREMDSLRVKGKMQPVRVCELVSSGNGIDAEACEAFKRGVSAYRNGDWETSQTAFNAVLAASADDVPSRVYIERIAHFQRHPPPTDWNGVWVLEEK
jgi:adenylate cyclase